MVSSSSITGAKGAITDEQLAYFERVRSMELKNKRLTLSADLEGEQEFAFELDATEGRRPALH